jgi:hypothetical protein
MQVIPRFVSTGVDGESDAREFLQQYFDTVAEMNSLVFLKGYQWPFDSRKVCGGSSLVDIFVYIETVIKGRRVFLDFTRDCEGFSFADLSGEAKEYLEKSGATQELPIERLRKMNPGAVQLYLDNGIDITSEMLEVDVCVQHNNGGIAGNIWWESTNIKHLFPVGEVNGSHGIYRPGGSALNSGQVGAIRAAEFIANKYNEETMDFEYAKTTASQSIKEWCSYIKNCWAAEKSWREERSELQNRMSYAGAHIRSVDILEEEIKNAKMQFERIRKNGCAVENLRGIVEAARNVQLCFSHLVYLEAMKYSVESGTGSRGSSMVIDKVGKAVHEALGDEWNFSEEDEVFREKVQTTVFVNDKIKNKWTNRRPIPDSNTWFESAWASYRNGEIYNNE